MFLTSYGALHSFCSMILHQAQSRWLSTTWPSAVVPAVSPDIVDLTI